MAQKKSTTARKNPAAKKPAAKRVPPSKKFIRNANYSPFRIQLERQEKGKSIQLKPRGERGDFAPLQKDDLNDPNIQANLALGVIEIITEAEALAVARKQTTNQQATHPALSLLRNETGEPYAEGAIKVEEQFEDQGVTVATLEDGNVAFDRGGISNRVRGPGEAPLPPEGVVGAEPPLPQAEDPAIAADRAARQKNVEGPQAGLGGIERVVVNEPKKT